MYWPSFGLAQDPFSIAPDPRFLFMSECHREALAHLLYGVKGGGGFVLLTGEIGAGKTTVCRCFLAQLPPDCDVAYVFNPKLSATELLHTVLEEFRLPRPAENGLKACVDALNAFLLASVAGVAIWAWLQSSISMGAIAVAIALVMRIRSMSDWIPSSGRQIIGERILKDDGI